MRWVVGLLLVGAALLKGTQLFLEPAVVLASPVGQVFMPVQIAAELAIGLLALFGLYWRNLRWLALLLFTGFALYSLSLAVSGATSCGCFGSLKIHPWWTFGLDIAIVLGLLLSISKETAQSSASVARPRLAMTLGTLALCSAFALGLYAAPRQTAESLQTVGDLVVLEPEKWVGKPLPVADYIDLDLSSGSWIVVFHRHDCPKCQEAVPRYKQLATGKNVALVEVPPYGSGHSQHARLRNDRDWFVQTPVEIRLRDGIVVSASTDLPSLATAMEP